MKFLYHTGIAHGRSRYQIVLVLMFVRLHRAEEVYGGGLIARSVIPDDK